MWDFSWARGSRFRFAPLTAPDRWVCVEIIAEKRWDLSTDTIMLVNYFGQYQLYGMIASDPQNDLFSRLCDGIVFRSLRI